jgi:hypothetical protein
VYAESSAQVWLTDLYTCAAKHSAALNLTAVNPDIVLKIGEPENFFLPAYQIGEEEIVLAVHESSPIKKLSLDEARKLFSRMDSPAQVWVFAPGADLQRGFDALVMRGVRVTSSARVAASAGQISSALSSDPNAVGILPRQWIKNELRVVFSAGFLPVLAIAKQEPQGITRELIACLQK